jgi:hypothetical protein
MDAVSDGAVVLRKRSLHDVMLKPMLIHVNRVSRLVLRRNPVRLLSGEEV